MNARSISGGNNILIALQPENMEMSANFGSRNKQYLNHHKRKRRNSKILSLLLCILAMTVTIQFLFPSRITAETDAV
jgi:hypothetical protein